MNRERLDGWCEQCIVGLVLAILVAGPLGFGGTRTSEFVLLEGLTMLVMLLWLVRLWIHPRLHLLWPPACWWVLAFAGYAVARYGFADIEYVARQELVRVLLYTALFLACLNNLYRQDSVRMVVYTLVLLGTAEACFATYQFVSHSPRIWGLARPQAFLDRASGTYICPNHLAGLLEMILPLGVAYTVASRTRPVGKVFLGYGCVAMTAAMAFSVSRGGWVAAVFGLVVLLALLARTARQWVALALFVVLLLGLGRWAYSRSLALQLRMSAAKKMVERGVQNDTRYGLALAAFKMWKDHPWFGVGPAHYDVRYRGYRGEHGLWQSRPGRAHNDYLNTLADWGTVGAVLVAGCFGSVAFSLARWWRHLRRIKSDPSHRKGGVLPFLAGASAGLAAILLHSAFDFNMHIPANAILAVVLLALLASHLRFATDKYWVSVTPLVRAIISCLLVSGLVFFFVQARKAAREDYWSRHARSLPELSEERIAALEQALAVEPGYAETALHIAEQYRWRSWRGEEGYEKEAQTAIEWFQRAAGLDRYDPLAPLGIAACLDWLDQHQQAEPWYDKALELDPYGYRVLAQKGWHCYLVEDYAGAIELFKRVRRLDYYISPLVQVYYPLAEQKLKEQQQEKNRKK